MANRDLVLVGTSAGGVSALRTVAGGLSADLPACLLVVIHLSRERKSELDAILAQAGPFTASFAADGDPVRAGHIYIAPPDRHLLLQADGRSLVLGDGPRENVARPGIDPLFRSAAVATAHRAIGVVMTGTLYDGASGLNTLKQHGGITVVQDPDDADFPEMPETALRRSDPDYVVPLAGLPSLINKLAQQPAGTPRAALPGLVYEVDVARGERGSMGAMDSIGRRSVLTCPDCHGVMWELEEGDVLRYRCHVGHAFSADMMKVALDESLHRAIGSALRVLEERLALARKLEQDAIAKQRHAAARDWSRTVRDFEREIETIRSAVVRVNDIAARHAADVSE
jgi:two-component system, chemotaxis family, protein-glutamate methylesterase/glutaminase